MEFFSGLDVSIDETAICVVGDKGAVHLQTAVATDAAEITGAATVPSTAAARWP